MSMEARMSLSNMFITRGFILRMRSLGQNGPLRRITVFSVAIIKGRELFSSLNLISNFSWWINISNEILYTSIEENCCTKDILYSSRIKMHSKLQCDTRKFIPWQDLYFSFLLAFVIFTLLQKLQKENVWNWRNMTSRLPISCIWKKKELTFSCYHRD